MKCHNTANINKMLNAWLVNNTTLLANMVSFNADVNTVVSAVTTCIQTISINVSVCNFKYGTSAHRLTDYRLWTVLQLLAANVAA